MDTVALPDGSTVAQLGLGTWRMGEHAQRRAAEIGVVRLALDLGITLIDTAEMYADGGAEALVGEALAGRRDQAFIVSKVYPHNASRRGVPAACERSLKRLRTDRIDLYLLHWRGEHPLAETVEAFERLRQAGKIRRWGVSNLDVDDLEELAALPAGSHCTTDQVHYSASARGVEFDLLPWLRARRMPMMAYSPIDEGRLADNATLAAIGARHGASAAQVALAWVLRHPDVIAIAMTADARHLRDNRAALELRLAPADLAELDRRFAPPARKAPLSMI